MFINASKNFNLNITWAASFSGKDILREALLSGGNRLRNVGAEKEGSGDR